MLKQNIQAKLFTYDDYLLLADDKRYEILNGTLEEMSPAPLFFHQIISVRLTGLLSSYLDANNKGILAHAPVDVVFDNNNLCQPDLIVILNENKKIITEKNIQGAPDLVVEILSPSTFAKDIEIKKRIYERFKVKEYWILDPANKVFEIFALENDFFELKDIKDGSGKVNSILFNNLELDLEHIFKPV